MNLNMSEAPTPSYVVDERLLVRNLEILQDVQERAGCKILLAQKGFSMYAVYPLIGRYLCGTTASSLHEARLGKEEMGGEVHIYSPAYNPAEMEDILSICDHMVFNTFAQWEKFKPQIQNAARHISCGIRVNPEYSEIETDLYNPCFENSRLGTTQGHFDPEKLDGIEGLHFHTMCEQNSDTLKRTLRAMEEKFGGVLGRMKWVNFGGGHHITRPDYDRELLIECILRIKEIYGVEVYLEPGEAVALNTGFLVASVLDTMENGMDIAILDTSAACHMPDVLEMPYRPAIVGAGYPGEHAHTYRLAGPTCLAGDVIGDYSFPAPLREGDRLVFCDMAHYTMVKNNTFNGVNLPAIVLYSEEKGMQILRQFGYADFKSRL